MFFVKRRQLLVGSSLVFLSLLLYLYKLPAMASFDADQEFYAKQFTEIVFKHNLTLIGIPASIDGLFVGPLYTYVAALFYWVFGGHPIGLNLFTVLILSFQGPLTYYCIGKIKGERIGLFAALLCVFTFAYWKKAFIPTPINFLYMAGLFFFYFLFRLEKSRRYIYLIALLLGLTLHIHFTLLFFFPIFFILLFRQKGIRGVIWYDYLISSLIVLFFALPMVFFDLRHNFLLAKGIFLLFNTVHPNISYFENLAKVLGIFFSVFSSLLFGPQGLLSTLLFWLPVLWVVLNIKKNYSYQIVGLIFLTTLLLFSLYYGHIPDYYFYFLLPMYFFIVSDMVNAVNFVPKGKLFVLLFFALFISYNLFFMLQALNPYNLFIKQKAVRYIKDKAENAPVTVNVDTELGLQYGFDYLMDFNKINRSKEKKTSIYQIQIRDKRTLEGKEFRENGANGGIIVSKLM